MKKFFFQICAICILCFSFTSTQAQCEDCYQDALSHYESLPKIEEGECGYWALEAVEQAIVRFNSIQTAKQFEYSGYVLMNKILVYMSALSSCNDECGSESCNDVVDKANELSNCLFDCGHPYAEDLCKTAAYIECQCDCACDNPAGAECDNDPCVGEECNCLFVLFSGQSRTKFDGCCEVTISMRAPECCETTLAPHYDFSGPVTLLCDVEFEQSEDQTSVVITVCCPEALEEGMTVQVNTTGDCEVQSQPFPLAACDN